MTSPIQDGFVPWPDDLATSYIRDGVWGQVSIGDLLVNQAEATPTREAIVDGQTRLSFGDLLKRSDSCARALLDLGLAPGDRIVMQLPNCWEFAVLFVGCMRSGIVPVMALPAHRGSEIRYLADHCDARALAVPEILNGFDHLAMAHSITDASKTLDYILVSGDVAPSELEFGATCSLRDMALNGPVSSQVLPSPAATDIALFLLSGGTTGLPKLISRTHNDYVYNAAASAEVSAMDDSTVYLVSLPASHNFPLACPGILGTWLVGGSVVMLPSPKPGPALATIEAEAVTHTSVVPAVAGAWIQTIQAEEAPTDLSTLRVFQVGGSRMPEELARLVAPVLGATLQQVFGMAEGLLNYTDLDADLDLICTTQGRPLSSADEVRILDEDDNDVEAGELGALVTRGPYTPRGYYRADGHNQTAFTHDGWLRTGDVCRQLDDGSLIVEGRDKDMINRGGEKVSAEEVENLMYQLDGVRHVAAVAMPDSVLGERVCVFVVLGAGVAIDLDAVRGSMHDAEVAKYKWPERIELVDELPLTKVGKIDKKALRAVIADRLNDHGA